MSGVELFPIVTLTDFEYRNRGEADDHRPPRPARGTTGAALTIVHGACHSFASQLTVSGFKWASVFS
jgi:hypothetical protein